MLRSQFRHVQMMGDGMLLFNRFEESRIKSWADISNWNFLALLDSYLDLESSRNQLGQE